ncbi:hypothetical protein EVAR_14355_1 [Eumeta japonica]|uniref:Uncharacterized protein n=1 Tax=Eumeta variegata TaxID=151549 RepID=A0A4C1TX13_EUMVA|nr:hypothetical protein EVAR_14355_1 [Eumeta japonica]
MEWKKDRRVTSRTLRPLVPLYCSALSLARSAQAERDNESRFFTCEHRLRVQLFVPIPFKLKINALPSRTEVVPDQERGRHAARSNYFTGSPPRALLGALYINSIDGHRHQWTLVALEESLVRCWPLVWNRISDGGRMWTMEEE